MIFIKLIVTFTITFMVSLFVLKVNNNKEPELDVVDVISVSGIIISLIGIVISTIIGVWTA